MPQCLSSESPNGRLKKSHTHKRFIETSKLKCHQSFGYVEKNGRPLWAFHDNVESGCIENVHIK